MMEDNADDAALILAELRRTGLSNESVRVENEQQLRDALRDFAPHIVLSDHSAPGFSGLEALRIVERESPETPFIVVTGSVDEETAAEYIKAGATDYIVKHRLQRLGHAVRRALELRRALEEAAAAGTALARSEQRFRQLVEYSSDVITLLDAKGQIVYSTQALKPTLGYDQGELIGRSVFTLVHPDDQPQAEALFRGLFTSAEPVIRTELRVRHKEGVWRDLEIAGSNHLEDPIVNAIVINYHDVTDKKRAEAALRQAQKVEAIGRLAGGIAHDFNNLLTAILGSTELLLEMLPADHPGREEGQETRKAALRAADLTRQLLAFSRQQVLAPKVLVLNEVVVEMDRLLRRLLGEDVDLRIVLAKDLDPVRADPGQLEQVIVNLAVNARDAMPKGGQLTIETANVVLDAAYTAAHAVVPAGRYVVLMVSDSGTGMDAETQARIFEPFFTTKERGKGTGLGLATVYGIVKQSGGYIWVYSELAHGTTFKVYLPRVAAPIEPLAAPVAAAAASLRGTETILVVEDQDEVRNLVRRMLQGRGYTVLVAASGQEALPMAEAGSGTIDILVTDVVMPGIGGRELALLLAPSHPTMKVLYLSGYTDESIVHRGLLSPGLAFLQKPFSSDVLARKVREVLDS
jgi:PAS domain S-box-containing protein